MGVVYMAEQSAPIRRRVALKLLKPGLLSKQAAARFEAERQTLATLDHPNIAKVFDAGTTDSGRPYFVMELVEGMPVTDYCETHGLSPTERLELFVPICQAVQHSHRRGVIHRDLKPSNILVAICDGKPLPKVIDFGVAKRHQLQKATRVERLHTSSASLIGTPEYMSPEQADLENDGPRHARRRLRAWRRDPLRAARGQDAARRRVRLRSDWAWRRCSRRSARCCGSPSAEARVFRRWGTQAGSDQRRSRVERPV